MATVAHVFEDRKMSMGRVFERAFATIMHNPPIVAVVAIAGGGLTLLLEYAGIQSIHFGSSTVRAFFISSLAGVVVGPLTESAMTTAVLAEQDGRKATLGESLSRIFKLLIPLIGVTGVMTLGIVLGMLLIVIPGVLLSLMWAVAIPALIAERGGVLVSLHRSQELTEGARWKVFAVSLLVAVIRALIGGLFGAVIALAGARMYSPFSGTELTVVGGIASVALHAITNSIQGAVQPSLYIELRQWKEGGNTEQLAEVFG